MSKSFKEIYKRFVDNTKPAFIRKSFRLYPDYQYPIDEKRKANFETWKERGYKDTEENGLGVTLESVEGYTIFSQIKNATITDYDAMLLCFPNGDTPIIHLPHLLPDSVSKKYYDYLSLLALAIKNTAMEDGKQINRIYVHHHVGLHELNSHEFNISFPQLHMHVIGVTQEDLDQSKKNVKRSILIKSGDRNTFTDPTILVARDFIKNKIGINCSIDYSTSSLVLLERQLDLSITHNEKNLLIKLYSEWFKQLSMLQILFADLENIATNSRTAPENSIENRKTMIDFLFSKIDFLSEDSKTIISFLVLNAKQFDSSKVLNSFYNSVAGSVGYVHNFENNTSQLRFAPRLLVSAQKLGCSDGLYMGIKDKSKYYDDKERRILIQKRIFKNLKKLLENKQQNNHQANINIERVNSLFDLLQNCETRNNYQEIYFDKINSLIYKGKKRFTKEAIVDNYQKLKNTGMSIAEEPYFIQDQETYIEATKMIGNKNGADYLLNANMENSLSFFQDVILESLHKIFQYYNFPLVLNLAIDAIPHNFVYDEKEDIFKFVDYEPDYLKNNHKHFLIPYKLLNYAFVKFCREKPELFEKSLNLILDFIKYNKNIDMEVFFNQPHIKIFYLLKDQNYEQARSLIQNLQFHKDEILGTFIAVCNFIKIDSQKIIDYMQTINELNLGFKFHEKTSWFDFVNKLAFYIGKNKPEKLRTIALDLVELI